MTVGWIFEGDRDRFLTARELTPPPGRVLPSFRCPFCKTSFSDRELLSQHVQQSHVVSRPFILINGTEPGAEDIIRIRSTPSVETINCTELSAEVNGEPIRQIRPATLASRLATLTSATLRLRLANSGRGIMQPVVQEYRIKVLAPDEASLRSVDSLFLTTLGADDPNL